MAAVADQKIEHSIEYGMRGFKIRLVFTGATVVDGKEGNFKGLSEHPQYAMQDIITRIPEDPELRIIFYVPSNDQQHCGMIISRGDALPLTVFNGPTERTTTPGILPNTRNIFPLTPGDVIQVQTRIDRPLVEINVKPFC